MKKPDGETGSVAPEELDDFPETDLPSGVTFEDALRGFTEVDPEAVKDAAEKAKNVAGEDNDPR